MQLKKKALPSMLLLLLSLALSLAPAHSSYAASCDLRAALSRLIDNPPPVASVEQRLINFSPEEALAGANIKRYPKGVDPAAHPDWFFRYGWESEYTRDELGKVLEVYGPAPGLGVSREEWFAMTIAQREDFARQHMGRNPVYTQNSGFVKLVDEPGFDFLPHELIYDSTGNLEFSFGPVDTLEDWYRKMIAVNNRFGVGSMQGMTSLPREVYFGANAVNLPANLGYMNFVQEADPLEKLAAGAARYELDPSQEVARTFNHPWVGPMTAGKQDRMVQYMTQNSQGQYLDDRHLVKVSKTDGSFKYVGSTAYRPDIGTRSGHVAFEARDAHKNTNLLLTRVVRQTYFLANGSDQFAAFANTRALDLEADFNRLSPQSRSMLEQLFPSKADPREQYDHENRLPNEVYRNFAYPMRDWTPQLRALGRPDLARQVSGAQRAYEQKLADIAARLSPEAPGLIGRLLAPRALPITAQQAKLEVEGALAQFAKDSGLSDAYKRFESDHVLPDPGARNIVEREVAGSAPLKNAFPASAGTGPLDQRIQSLIQKYPDNVRWVNNVQFQANDSIGQNVGIRKKVLAISFSGLDPQQQATLLKDYTDALSHGTISFPLSARGGHLHARLGNQDFSAIGAVSVTPYRFSTWSSRMEAVVLLTPQEELNMRAYFEQASGNSRVIGQFNMAGVKSKRTEGKLTNNLPLTPGEGHNCTSWVCLAPIGNDGQSLEQLVGNYGGEVYTNPGWWSHYLSTLSNSPRAPFVVFMSPDSMDQLQDSLTSQPYKWDYNRH
jgi:hypothetical protein